MAVPVDPGTYTAGETLPPGLHLRGLHRRPRQSPAASTVALGESTTCTITNDDQHASLTLVKDVTNDNGGNAAPDDFLLTLGGDAGLSGVAVPVDPGTYTTGETLLPGYTFELHRRPRQSPGALTVALGESKTCTITNDDQQAHPDRGQGRHQRQRRLRPPPTTSS